MWSRKGLGRGFVGQGACARRSGPSLFGPINRAPAEPGF